MDTTRSMGWGSKETSLGKEGLEESATCGLQDALERNEKVMAEYVKDTYTLLREKAGKPLAAKIGRDAEFPRGPAGRAIVLTHMKASGYCAEQVEQAGDILSAAGIA